jgi:hypothetical protein
VDVYVQREIGGRVRPTSRSSASIDLLSIAPGSMSGRRSGRRRRADGDRDDDEDAEDPQKKAERLEIVSPARPAPDKDPRAACEV